MSNTMERPTEASIKLVGLIPRLLAKSEAAHKRLAPKVADNAESVLKLAVRRSDLTISSKDRDGRDELYKAGVSLAKGDTRAYQRAKVLIKQAQIAAMAPSVDLKKDYNVGERDELFKLWVNFTAGDNTVDTRATLANDMNRLNTKVATRMIEESEARAAKLEADMAAENESGHESDAEVSNVDASPSPVNA